MTCKLAIAYPRRKWARRGRAIADFILGLIISISEHVLSIIIRVWKTIATLLRDQKRACTSNLSRNTVNAVSPIVGMSSIADMSVKFCPLQGERSNVHFSDIAGLDEAKKEIELRMILPFRNKINAERFDIRRGGGLLLYGPPGTGKSMLAKAVAAELDAVFYHIRPSDIMSNQVGQAEKNIAELFKLLRRESRAVLFIDEIESLIPSRKHNNSTIMQRVISQILGEVDGIVRKCRDKTLFLIGATNEPQMIDSAMLRPGRFDKKVYCGPPDYIARKKILLSCLSGKPIFGDVNIECLSEMTNGMTGAELNAFVQQACDKAFLRSLSMPNDIINLAMDDFEVDKFKQHNSITNA